MKDLSEIAVVMTVRKKSTRCKNKLLRDYAETTLFDIALDKISGLKEYEIFVMDLLFVDSIHDIFFY